MFMFVFMMMAVALFVVTFFRDVSQIFQLAHRTTTALTFMFMFMLVFMMVLMSPAKKQ